jgi:osmotically-inducible protein OsmY
MQNSEFRMRGARLVAALLLVLVSVSLCIAKDPPVVNDDSISDHIRIAFASDKVVGVQPFDVKVKDGVVTLSGQADQGNQRSRAEKLAKKVKGVKQVVNNITLKK